MGLAHFTNLDPRMWQLILPSACFEPPHEDTLWDEGRRHGPIHVPENVPNLGFGRPPEIRLLSAATKSPYDVSTDIRMAECPTGASRPT